MNFYGGIDPGGIASAQLKADSAKDKVDRSAHQIEHLERKVDKLSLACQALWEMLCERTGLTDDQLLIKMQEVDLRDGVADGKMTRRVVECPACHRNSTTKRAKCLYCGADLTEPNVFDAV